MANPDLYPNEKAAELQAACENHLRDLRRAHRRGPPADVQVRSLGLPRFLPLPAAPGGMTSPAGMCADFA